MFGLLIAAGRFSVSVAAFLMILGSTIYGWFWGVALDRAEFGLTQGGATTPYRLLCAALGFLAGLIAAGSIFGIAAAIFDMQQSLRKIASTRRTNQVSTECVNEGSTREEPRLSSVR